MIHTLRTLSDPSLLPPLPPPSGVDRSVPSLLKVDLYWWKYLFIGGIMAPVSVAVHSLGAIAPCLPISARASCSSGKTEAQYSRSVQLPRSALNLACLKTRSIGQQNGLLARQVHLRTVTCSAALAARCSAEQTQTIERQSTTITVAPIQGKSPELDDGGSGFPPRDDDDGGGGGGGGGGNWSGGFWFFGFLALLGLLKDKESEAPSYRSDRR